MSKFISLIEKAIHSFIRILSAYLIPYLYEYIISLSKSPSKWKNEQVCRLSIETLTGCKFRSVYPIWLKNPLTDRSLELDGYNEKLSIAFEYQGQQHYSQVKRFQPTEDKFQMQIFRDQVKKSLCDEHGITLIIIPYTISTYMIPMYIHEKLHIIRNIRRYYL